ncbi:uncharacterized protein METZ01_LOCUS160612 [marine metagenome]|uniref:Uncharacterized protein n=1 Tax=marine metagenome TaxID=408172 RepID=A0A382B1Y8_9ZZZZ
MVAHTGFEPVVSALRGRCPWPLDECASGLHITMARILSTIYLNFYHSIHSQVYYAIFPSNYNTKGLPQSITSSKSTYYIYYLLNIGQIR